MNKILFILGILLVGCVNTIDKSSPLKSVDENQVAEQYVQEIEQTKSLTSAIDAYENKFGGRTLDDWYNGTKKIHVSCGTGQTFYYTKHLLKKDIRWECICSDNEGSAELYKSDDCILHRRKIGESSLTFFDYKRFLPDKYVTLFPTEQHFKFIYDMWKLRLKLSKTMLDEDVKACKESLVLTSDERAQCQKDKETFYETEFSNADDWVTYMDDYEKKHIKEAINEYNKYCGDLDTYLSIDYNTQRNKICLKMARWYALSTGKTMKLMPELVEANKKWNKALSENPSKQ